MKARQSFQSAAEKPIVLGPVDRRTLLTGAGAAAASAVLVARPAEAFHATPAENAPRYKESEHVKTFYRIAGR